MGPTTRRIAGRRIGCEPPAPPTPLHVYAQLPSLQLLPSSRVPTSPRPSLAVVLLFHLGSILCASARQTRWVQQEPPLFPNITILHSSDASSASQDAAAADCTAAIVDVLSKPAHVVCVTISKSNVYYGGERGGVTATVNSLGYGDDAKKNKGALAAKITATCAANLGVESEKVFIRFFDLEHENWSWNGKLLA